MTQKVDLGISSFEIEFLNKDDKTTFSSKTNLM